ncbi:hypothetical protein ABW19_dt0200675 [Dactylella cylindrospora]|nr:hypothetical protein ABW19_dt0200675 [Dactylella cylindrospora]
MLADLPNLGGRTVKHILTKVSQHLRNKESDGSAERPIIINSDEDAAMQDVSWLDVERPPPLQTRRRGSPMVIDLDEDDDLYTAPTSPVVDKGKQAANPLLILPPNRMAADLRAVKDAGFRLGYHGSLKGSGVCYVVISCRLSKTGISDNALDAWHVEPKRYISLIIEYPAGYVNADELLDDKKNARQRKAANIRMRIRQGDKYKPSRSECQAAFRKAQHGSGMPYVFQTLELFLNERLLHLVKKRIELGFSWYGAEEYYFTEKENPGQSMDALEARYWHDDTNLLGFSRLVTSDHLSYSSGPPSFPLLAMQFFLRHFARYTDFCLVCHRKVTSDVEALEPYVCSTPSCLSKYLSSDFGPGIERDLVEQPYVVDLLVSFCYSAAKHFKLKDFPDALGLKVPMPPSTGHGYAGTFDRANKELTLRIPAVNPISHPVQVGTWMSISGAAGGEVLCCRAVDMSTFPIIKVSDPISNLLQANALNLGATYNAVPVYAAGSQHVTVNLFNQDFASLDVNQKQECIALLLDSLPTVREMKDRLRLGHLSSWGDRIAPAALGVLRWVVASNRACIVQVDGLESGSQGGVFPATHTEDRVYGMGNWMQFRFAMGSPDKEQKFQKAVSSASSRLRLRYPTLFAWHGSPLVNWHSIIREGLNFNQTLNGRAYGNGCYHSMDFRTSQGYTGYRYTPAAGGDQWSKSVLKVSAAVALNEIVNAPGEFVSRSPHLVISQLDWICTRYLFVQCAFSGQNTGSQGRPAAVKPQDPSMTPNGEQGQIIIPQPKPTRARKEDQLSTSSGKKLKDSDYYVVEIDGIEERIPMVDDNPSDGTNESDLDVFFDRNGDSLELDSMDVAIALSMEEAGLTPPAQQHAPAGRRRRGAAEGGGGFFAGLRPRNRTPPRAENTPPITPGVSGLNFRDDPMAIVSDDSAAEPPAYEALPAVTPPSYTPISDSSASSGFFSNANSSSTSTSTAPPPEPPKYSSGVSSQPRQASVSGSSSGASSSRPTSLFGGFRRAFTNAGSRANPEHATNSLTALPFTNSVGSFGAASRTNTGKGKAAAVAVPATAPPVVAPAAITAPAPAAPVAVPPVVPIVAPVVPVAPIVAATPAPVPVPVAVPAPVPVPAPTLQPPKVPLVPKLPEPPKTDFVAGQLDYSTLPLIAQPSFATHAATKRLQKEYKNLLKIQESTPLHELGWYTNPDHFDNVYQWIVELHTFDSTLPLAQDMKARGIKSVVLELRFGASYPTTPPFVRVIRPKFLPFMNGGGGHVTIGGAVCLEMLTGTGWNSKTTIESVLLNIRLAMMSTDPKPARLEGLSGPGAVSSYGVAEAAQAYLRACRTHGWQVPKGFDEMANAMS